MKTVVNIVLEMKKTSEEKGRSMTAVELILQKFCPKSEGGGKAGVEVGLSFCGFSYPAAAEIILAR